MRPFETPQDDPLANQYPGESRVVSAVAEDTGDDVDQIQQLVRQLDLSGGTARIFRQPPGQSEFHYVGEVSVDGFSLDTIRRVHGGGRYQVKLAASNGRYVKQIKFSVDPRVIGEMDKKENMSVSTGGVQDNSMLATLLSINQEQSRRFEAAQQASAERLQKAQDQQMLMMVTMMTEFGKTTAAMIGAMVGREPRNVTPQEPASTLLSAVMPMLVANMQPRNGIGELVDTVKAVRELSTPAAQEAAPPEDMLDKVVKIGAPILGAFMSRNQPAPPSPTPPAQAQAQAQGTPLPPPQEDPAQRKIRELLGQLRFVTPMLVKAARRNADCGGFIDILFDTLDEEGIQYLVAFLQRDDWIQTLFNGNPDVVAQRGWFEKFRIEILESLTDEGEANPQDPEADKAG